MRLPLREALRKARTWLQNGPIDQVYIKRVTAKTPDTIFIANSDEAFAYVPEKIDSAQRPAVLMESDERKK